MSKQRCPLCQGRGTTIVVRRCPQCFGRELRARRVARGWSVRGVARRIGVSAAFLSDVELGRRNASPRLLIALRRLKLLGATE